MELLSIVVPVYNSKKYLGGCLESLVQQTYQEKEIILVDDGSTDGSGDMCDKYAEQYGFVKALHKRNGGVHTARNAGLEVAAGNYIAFVDSDDCLDFDAYEIMMKALQQTDSDVAACGYKTEYSDSFRPKTVNESVAMPFIYDSSEECLNGIGGGTEHCLAGFIWNKVIRKEAVQNIRFREDIPICDDLYFVYELMASIKRACCIGIPLYHYRYVAGSLSKNSIAPKYIQCLEGMKGLIGWCEIKAPQCLGSIYTTYIFWNTKACEQMLRNADARAYERIRENLLECREYIPECRIRVRLLARAILSSWRSYRILGGFFWNLKKFYVFLYRRH